MAGHCYDESPYTCTYDSDASYAWDGVNKVADGTQTAAPAANKLIDAAADFGGC